MRVTNMMTTNQLLLNLNKSMTALAFLQYQGETGNKIRYASDDPIIAGRSLKFRTNIVETDQYLSNVDQGRSWLQTTENAMKNVLEALSGNADNSIRTLLVGAANGTYTISDTKIFSNQLYETLNELMGELNTTYAGRYIFSGFKTDEKPVFDIDEPKLKMEISQDLKASDIDNDYRIYIKTDKLVDVDENKVPTGTTTPSTLNMDDSAMPQEISVNRLKLAYDVGISSPITIGGITIKDPDWIKNSSTDADAYLPGDDEIFFIEDTGELIFGSKAYNDLMNASPSMEGLTKSALNAFDAIDINDPASITVAVAAITALKNSVQNYFGADYDISDFETQIDLAIADTSAISPSAPTSLTSASKELQKALNLLGANYTKEGFKTGDINPKVYFTCTDKTTGKSYNMDNQSMMYEFSINNKMQINTLAKDVLTTSLINDIKDAIKLVDNINLSDYDTVFNNIKYSTTPPMTDDEATALAEEQIQNETKFYTDLIGKKFTELIGKVDKHQTDISLQNTSIGSRILRLDLISNRLQDDRINFEDLKSQNDGVDAAEVYIRYSSMVSVYQSALQIGAKVIQMSLVNFI